MDFGTRLKGAWSLLFGRGDNATVCSFCGQSRHAVEQLIAGPGATSICNRCIFLCNQVLLEHAGPPGFRRHAEGAHAKAISIQLGHDDVILASVERVALEALLAALVDALPESQLAGWSYMHGQDRFDLLTVEIVTTAPIATDDMRVLANDHWRQMRDAAAAARRVAANEGTPSLIDIAESATHAARAYAQAVAQMPAGSPSN